MGTHMRLHGNKKNNRIKIAAAAALVLVAAFSVVGIYRSGAFGADSDAVEAVSYAAKAEDAQIGTKENPFTVLEIVPHKDMATIGYLIPGCEPKNIETDTEAMLKYGNIFGAAEDGIAQVDFHRRGCFLTDVPSNLAETEAIDNEDSTTLHFGEYGYFEHADNEEGRYRFDADTKRFVPIQPGDTVPENTYRWVQLRSYQQLGTDDIIPASETYLLSGDTFTDQAKDGTKTYYTFEEGTGDNPFYRFDEVEDFDSESEPNNQAVSLAIEKAGTTEDKVGSRFYQFRYEKEYKYYMKYAVNHKNQLLSTLFADRDSLDGFHAQVITVTPEQLKGVNINGEHNIIADADMIVLHDSAVAAELNNKKIDPNNLPNSFSFEGRNLDDMAFQALIQKQASGNPAILWFDESAINDGSGKGTTNFQKFYAVCNGIGAKYYYNVYCNSQETDTDGKPLWTREKDPNADDTYQLPNNLKKGSWCLGASSFVFNWDGSEEVLTKTVSDGKMLEAIAKMYYTANSLSYDAENGVITPLRSKLHILEIEPAPKFKSQEDNWRSYFMAMLPDDFVGTSTNIADDMKITAMATYEFNGKIDDLNATYDMVFIGAEQDETNGLVTGGKGGYNDKKLNNYDAKGNLVSALAYTTVGDLMSTDTGKSYYVNPNQPFPDDLDPENQTFEFFLFNLDKDLHPERYRSNHWYNRSLEAWTNTLAQNDYNFIASDTKGSDFSQCNIRYNATDISKKQYMALCSFAMQNTIVVDGGLYTDSGKVDTNVVDSSSYVYNLAALGADSKANPDMKVETYGAVRSGKSRLTTQTLLKPGCSIAFSPETDTRYVAQGAGGKPIEYSYEVRDADTKRINKSSIRVNNQKDEAKNNVLRYHFTLYGEADKQYQAVVGIDANGNGDFAAEETSTNLTIVDETETARQGNTVFVDQSNGGFLTAGHTYSVTRTLPMSEAGMLPWELEISQKEQPNVRDVAKGYTRVPGAEKTTIRVLQMNLSSNNTMKYNVHTDINFADTKSDIGRRFQQYLNDVDDYKIEVTFMDNNSADTASVRKNTATDYYNKHNQTAEAWTEYLMEYDMLILGFRDFASFTDDKIFLEGFKAFVDSGHSVILSHDMVSDITFAYPTMEWKVDPEISGYLRELSGQVRYFYSNRLTKDNQLTKGSISEAYSRGESVKVYPDSDLRMGYMHHRDSSLPWDKWYVVKLLPRDAYLYRLPKAGVKACNVMDNSARSILFTSEMNQRTDRTILSPKNGSAVVQPNELVWTESYLTNTVKVANKGQITQYPFIMEDTISVASTHVQNFKLNLDEGYENAFNDIFHVDGEFAEWEEIPKTEVTWNDASGVMNAGATVYHDGMAYGYAQANNNGSSDRDGGAFAGLHIELRLSDGTTQEQNIEIFAADETGAVTRYPKMEGLDSGDYLFYLGSTGFSSTNINNLVKNPYWHDDYVYGTMRMHIEKGAGADTMEYQIDVSQLAECMKIDLDSVEEVTACWYGLSSVQGTPPRFASGSTDAYVKGLTRITDTAIVWYNLSNDGDDATNIYASKDGDSANNYYMYTKGNVTYTGFGHAGTMTNDEIRLFINTMISAYRSAAADPYPTCVNSDATKNNRTYTIYAEERDGTVRKDVDLQIKVNDDSVNQRYNNYTLRVVDDAGVEVLRQSGLSNGQVVTLNVMKKGDTFKKANRTYKATLTATDNQSGVTEESIYIRVLQMPLLGLD